MSEEKITLYKHPLGQEMGLINLVIPSTPDPNDDDEVTLILTSEYSSDQGVVFTVEIYNDIYEEMCEDYEVETLEGCILSTFGEQINIEEVPEDPPPGRSEASQKQNTVRVLMTPNMWKHRWGRCCCVKRGDEHIAVTSDAIAEGTVPFWNSPFTPYELDMIDAARDPENKGMHVLLDSELICGRCGHNVWVVHPEEVPEDLPSPPQYVEVPEPLCDDQQALDEIAWTSKGEAWEIFYTDEANRKVIKDSNLAIERANNRKRFTQEKKFEPFNRAHGLGRNIYTVKQAFYAALGFARSGTWADFDLGMLRLINDLGEVDMPAEILDMVRLENASAQAEMTEQVEQRATRAVVDQDATILQFMLDEEATEDTSLDDVDIKEISEVIEPTRQKPKATPRVCKPRVEITDLKRLRPQAKNREVSSTTSTVKEAKANLITACTKLQEALVTFVQVLQDDEEDKPNGGSRRAGG